MSNNTLQLRQLLKKNTFLHLPSVSDPLQGRLVESLGFEAVFIGGYVSGASSAITEPLMTMTEQVKMAQDITGKVNIPLIADAGAGWGDSLHTMRTVSEFIRAGVAGIHIEDQVFPKRAHYHKYVVHGISREEYIEKISYACKERDRLDPHFVIIARTDTCRSVGLDEAVVLFEAVLKYQRRVLPESHPNIGAMWLCGVLIEVEVDALRYRHRNGQSCQHVL